MDLRTGTAGTRIAHLPEVVVLVTVDDMILGHMLRPIFGGLVVAGDILLRRTLENGHVEVIGIQLQHIYQILPGHIDGTFLEIVAEAPVSQHLEHRMVVGVVTYLFQIVMLSANSQTLLRVCGTECKRGGVAQEYIFELVHSRVCEHQRRVVLDYHRCARHDRVFLFLEEIQECLSNLS